MSAITKPRTNIFKAIVTLFSSGIDIEGNEDIELPEELNDALKALENEETKVEQAINVDNKSSKKGGFGGKKINPSTEKAMRAIHNEVKKTVEDKERE